ncbi:copper ABC transporter, permease protein NosY [Hyphomicrobium denitrificans ATCC 51888]|uniref:Copper ABC transporter, permease protein NosY n=1 Tax=Hyphomicrobium denitrificans (strain ATCC 51888 / DSM 1869 / NCIMB 11706 / TK 0415) TaxID=582899 RepID=D8JZ80_HYPDA|nr:ABC transporter permease subunit [Hyphomicrobium denitrificans]ADJ23682.1 copper ABC transporter, permease protein NosY [Hyphomicrobium denitrificans ATCC 51888]
MTNILLIAWKEIQECLRNRWVVAMTLLLAALALSLTFLGSAPTGTVGTSALDVVIVSLSSLTIFVIPLVALLISHDAIVGEMERGTMLLLLSYPVSRLQVLLGKFLGHLAVLTFATAFGYGAAAIALMVSGAEIGGGSWAAFAGMILTSILLGAVFIAIGYLISALVRERATAAGISIGVWLLLVVLFDMAMLGALVVDQGRTISSAAVSGMLLFNPTDVYRLFNLAGAENVSVLTNMSGIADQASLSPAVLLATLVIWVLVPLTLAGLTFSRREL